MSKRKKEIILKITLPIIAFLVVIFVGNISRASGTKNQPFLGKAGLEFGIICNFFNQTGDVESNFAAVKYQRNKGGTIGNTISENMANAAGKILVGEIVNDDIQVRHGNKVVIEKGENARSKVLEYLQSIKKYSKSVVERSDVKSPRDVSDQNNYVIDISSIRKDEVYVDADNLAENMTDGKIQNGGLKIKLRKDQTIIFNIMKSGKVILYRYDVIVTNGTKTMEDKAQSVIWNMPEVKHLEISSDSLAATIIAPDAHTNLNVTGSGWLVCEQINSTEGEWHMIWRSVPKYTTAPPATTAPAKTAPAKTAPAKTAPATTAPAKTAPATTAPAKTAPATTAPAKTAPATTAPATTAPATTAPAKTAPATTAPATTAPATTAPAKTAPATTAPATTAPATTTPATTAPAKTAPATTAPAKTTPATTVPAPSAPVPTVTGSETETPAPTGSPYETETSEPTISPAESETPVPTASELVKLDDEDVPLADMDTDDKDNSKNKKKDKTTIIQDDDVPLSDAAPETGDAAHPTAMLVGLGVSFILIIIVFAAKRKFIHKK